MNTTQTQPSNAILLLVALLAGAAPLTASITRLEQGDPLVQYSGAWYSNSESGNSGSLAALTNAKDAAATIIFSGTGITWIGYSDGWSGLAWVYLDGTLTTVDTYSANPMFQRTLFSARGLPAGSHNLTIVVPHQRGPDTQGAWVWIDAFDIENGSGVPGGAIAGAGRSEQSSPAVTYAGIWYANNTGSLSGGSASMAIDPGSLATFTFNGTGVSWIGYGDAWSGIANVSLDGGPKAPVDTYRATTQNQTALFSASGLPAGSHTITIETTGTHNAGSAESWIWLDAFDVVSGPGGGTTAPAINSGGLLNGASFSGSATPGAIASLFGTGFAPSPLNADGLPAPTTLGSTTVRINGIPAPLFFVSPTQINLQVPWELAGQTQALVTVTTGTVSSASVSLPIASLAPGLFTTNNSGAGQAAALISGTSSVAAPVGAFPGSRPVRHGELISIYCTGLGAVTSQPVNGNGSSAAPLAVTAQTTTIRIGGVATTPIFAGLAPGFVGLYQVDVQIPAQAPSGLQVPITVSIGGATSNTASVAVE